MTHLNLPGALLWGSLLLGALSETITPMILPIEIPAFNIPERLVINLSLLILGLLYWFITKKKRWALIVFTLYYLVTLYFSVRLALYLLAVVGPFSLVFGLQIITQGLALVLLWHKTTQVKRY